MLYKLITLALISAISAFTTGPNPNPNKDGVYGGFIPLGDGDPMQYTGAGLPFYLTFNDGKGKLFMVTAANEGCTDFSGFCLMMAPETIDYVDLWAKASAMEGGTFYGIGGPFDTSGPYGQKDSIFNEGNNIGIPVHMIALEPTQDDSMVTENLHVSFIFEEGKVVYPGPPMWNGAYPDTFVSMSQWLGMDPITLQYVAAN